MLFELLKSHIMNDMERMLERLQTHVTKNPDRKPYFSSSITILKDLSSKYYLAASDEEGYHQQVSNLIENGLIRSANVADTLDKFNEYKKLLIRAEEQNHYREALIDQSSRNQALVFQLSLENERLKQEAEKIRQTLAFVGTESPKIQALSDDSEKVLTLLSQMHANARQLSLAVTEAQKSLQSDNVQPQQSIALSSLFSSKT